MCIFHIICISGHQVPIVTTEAQAKTTATEGVTGVGVLSREAAKLATEIVSVVVAEIKVAIGIENVDAAEATMGNGVVVARERATGKGMIHAWTK